MRNALAAFLLFALLGCGEKPAPVAVPEAGSTSAAAVASEEDPSPSPDADGITAIDAASGEARAMPADSFAPSAYDLAQRAEAVEAKEAQRAAHVQTPAAADDARLSAPTDLLSGDESVTTDR